MLEAIFNETIQAVTLTGLTQWDYGQKLYIKGLNLPEVIQVHFSNDRETEAIVRVGTKQGEHIVVDIPNSLLEKYYDITAWVYVVGENSGETIRVIYLKVDSRKKPQDFISHNPSAEDLMQDLIDKVNQNIADNAEFKKDITEQQSNFEKTITQQQNTFETTITNNQNNFETEITERQESFEQRVENKTGYTREEADERFIPTALQGTFATDLSEEYKGVASDYGAEILKIEGRSEQATTNGYQLFDASKFQTKTQGGATVTNNGDGSFTVSGSGNLTDNFRLNYVIETPSEVKKLFKAGNLTLTNGSANSVPYFEINITANGKNNYLRDGTIKITDEIMNATDLRINFTFYGTIGSAIKGATFKPMLYQDGDGTWEPFTGGMPSPNPNYPQEINNSFDEPLVSVSRNLVIDNLKGFIGGGTSDHHITIDNNSETFYFRAKKGQQYSFGADVNLSRKTIGYCFEKPVNGAKIYGFTTSIQKTFIAEYDTYCCIYVSETLNNEIKKSFRVNEGNELLPYEPYKYAETELNFQRMCSLPDGTCDTYENGVSTQRIALYGFSGHSREDWKIDKTYADCTRFYIAENDIKRRNDYTNSIMCNRLKTLPSHTTKEKGISSYTNSDFPNQNWIYVNGFNEFTTVEQFKEWLGTHPINIQYELETPIVLEVDKRIVPTFYPYTNIFQSDDVKTKIQYGLRSKADYIESYMNAKQLLINNDFQVNQRGQTVYDYTNKGGHTVDMWLVNQMKVSVLSDGWVKVENLRDVNHLFQQKFGFSRKGKHTVTLNVRNIKGEINLSFEQENGTEIKVGNIKEGRNEFTFDATTMINVAVGVKPNSSVEIEYFDLFEGDVAYDHKTEDYTITLLKCQSKLFTICNSDFAQSLQYFFGNKRRSELIFSYLLPTKMTTTPTMISELGKLYSLNTDSEILPNKLSIRFDITNNQIVRFFIKKTDNSVFPITDDYQILLKKLILTCEPA